MSYTQRLTDRVGVCGVVFPVSANNTTKSTEYVDMTIHRRALFILSVGATDCTVDMALHASKTPTNGDSSDKAVDASAAITQFGATDDNHIKMIELSAEDLHQLAGAGFNYVKALVTVSNATAALVSVIAIGSDDRWASATDYDLASVTQVVVA